MSDTLAEEPRLLAVEHPVDAAESREDERREGARQEALDQHARHEDVSGRRLGGHRGAREEERPDGQEDRADPGEEREGPAAAHVDRGGDRARRDEEQHREERHEPLGRPRHEVHHVADPRGADGPVHVPSVQAEVDDARREQRHGEGAAAEPAQDRGLHRGEREREEDVGERLHFRLPGAYAAGSTSPGRSQEVRTSTSSTRVTSTAGMTRASWNSPCAVRSSAVSLPTLSPRGKTPSVPEVTTASPSMMSSERSAYSSFAASGLPSPRTLARARVRSTRTAIELFRSVSARTSALWPPTASTRPTTPSPTTTGMSFAMPSSEPRSMVRTW